MKRSGDIAPRKQEIIFSYHGCDREFKIAYTADWDEFEERFDELFSEPKFNYKLYWLDAEGDQIDLMNEKTFEFFMESAVEKKIYVKDLDLSQRTKVIFRGGNNEKIIYSTGKKWLPFVSGVEESVGARVSDAIYRVYWIDGDGDNFEIENDKSFDMFMKYKTDNKIYIEDKKAPGKQQQLQPIKAYFTKLDRKQVEYCDSKGSWTELLKEISANFNILFSNSEYRLYWLDGEKNEFDIRDDKSFELFFAKKLNEAPKKVYIVEKKHQVKVKVHVAGPNNKKRFYCNTDDQWTTFLSEIEKSVKIELSEYAMYWIDEDKEEIEIFNDETFGFFYNNVAVKKHVYIVPKTAGIDVAEIISTIDIDNESIMSENVNSSEIYCNGCGTRSWKGFRYKCIQCYFNNCANCEQKKLHNHHVMFRIPTAVETTDNAEVEIVK